MLSKNLLSSFDLEDYMEKHGISGKIEVLDASTKTVIQASVALGVSQHQIIKSILFFLDEKTVLVISAGTSPIDKKMVRKHFGVSKRQLRIAKALEVFEFTGYKIGTVPPFGHKEKIKTIIDPSVMECHTVYGGGGDLMTMLGIESAVLLKHTNAEVVKISK